MFSRIRKHLTPSTAIALLALVFALTGGAFAATNHSAGPLSASTAKSKAKAKTKAGARGPAGPAGKNGAVGPAGPAGAQGPAGAAGAAGAKGEPGAAGTTGAEGKNGTNGESVTSATIGNGVHCGSGGSEFKAGSAVTYACNGKEGKEGSTGKEGPTGKEGSPWTDGGTLPSKSTETGTWFASGMPTKNPTGAIAMVVDPVSFPIPLKADLPASLIGFEEGEGEKSPASAITAKECEGTYKEPKAAPGHFCLFVGRNASENVFAGGNAIFPQPLDGGNNFTVSTTGALIDVWAENSAEDVFADGTWAVTAP